MGADASPVCGTVCVYCSWVQGRQSCPLEGNHALSLQAQEVEDERLLDFQLLRAYHYQSFQLKTLHAIAEGVTTRLAGRQEMPAPNLCGLPRTNVGPLSGFAGIPTCALSGCGRAGLWA